MGLGLSLPVVKITKTNGDARDIMVVTSSHTRSITGVTEVETGYDTVTFKSSNGDVKMTDLHGTLMAAYNRAVLDELGGL